MNTGTIVLLVVVALIVLIGVYIGARVMQSTRQKHLKMLFLHETTAIRQ